MTDLDGTTKFCWSEEDKGLMKSSFFYGYLILQVIGGSLAERFGTKRVLALALGLTSLITITAPFQLKFNAWLFFALRLVAGLATGVTYPTLPPMITKYDMWSKSTTLHNRSYCLPDGFLSAKDPELSRSSIWVAILEL